MIIWQVVVAGIVLIALTCLSAQYGLRYIYNYRITQKAVQVVLLGVLPVRWIAFNNINDIGVVLRKDLPWNPWGTELWGNRLFGDMVLVRKKKGLVKTMLITPDNAHEFVQACLSHIIKNNDTNGSRAHKTQ